MTSDSENWEQLQALFHLAEDVPDDALDPLLFSACPEPGLRSRAKTLIVAERKGRLESASSIAPAQTGRIGTYTILRHLGSGGIGSVYLVERIVGGAVQRTALKVLSLHATEPFFIERFAREQHILASLDHPNITRMLDAGISETGQPYLVMEYVDGVHLDTYCDDRSLGIPERLQLFVCVCEAVAYAHRNLVVHLDLKPSNILVTEAEGNVKLLDFGTSKLIRPDSLLTTTVMATPAYASPEQLRNEGITTSCDIYTLGAILFELLAGRRPNHDSSVAIMIERIMKELPSEPLTEAVTAASAENRGLTETRLRSELSGDLATIVAKCLTPRPKDRYTSVDALILDLQRYIAGRPILARPQTTTYRIGKFVRRNRKSVSVGVFALLALTATSSYALWRQHQAAIAGERALKMQTFMYRVFKLANTNYTGKPSATIPEFLQLGVRVLPDFIKDPADLRAAQLSLAESMFDNGDLVHAQPVFDQVIVSARKFADVESEVEAAAFGGSIAYSLGHNERGEALGLAAVDLSHKNAVSPSARIWAKELYASSHWNIGRRTEADLQLLQDAMKELESHEVPDRQRAWTIGNMAEIMAQVGKLDQAQRLAEEALVLFKRQPYSICDQADTLSTLGDIRDYATDYPGALNYYRQAHDGFSTCSGAGSLQTLTAQVQVARAMIKLGQNQAAANLLKQSMPAFRSVVSSPLELAPPLIYLARAEELSGHFSEAAQAAEETWKAQDGKVDPATARMAFTQLVWAVALEGSGQPREALRHAKLADYGYTAGQKKSPEGERRAIEARTLLSRLQNNSASTLNH